MFDFLKKCVLNFRFSYLLWGAGLFIVFSICRSEIQYRYQKRHLAKLSPKQIVSLYCRASWRDDYDLQRQLLYDSSKLTRPHDRRPEEQTYEGIETFFVVFLGFRNRGTYEKIYEPNSAVAGVSTHTVYWPFAKRPTGMNKLTHDGGIWKICGNKWNYGNMLSELEKNPSDPLNYYYCAIDFSNAQNHLQAYRFRKRYYELDPEGFWITKCFIKELNLDEMKYKTHYKEYEEKLVADIMQSPEDWSWYIIRSYLELSRLMMFHEDLENAEHYLKKAAETAATKKDRHYEDDFEDIRTELKQRQIGTYTDPLERIEELRREEL